MAEDLRYPIGKFDRDVEVTPESIEGFIQTISELPKKLRSTVEWLSEEQQDVPYREGGWSSKQVVHHVADSHINSFCRFKLALTEDNPTIRPYFEDRWAELADSKLPIWCSLDLIEATHYRWTELLRSMSEEDFDRKLNHPESGEWTLGEMLALYDWHSKHHTAQIAELKRRNGW